MGFGKWQTRSKKWSFEVYCSKENAYHREHAVAKNIENENGCPETLRGLSADSPRASVHTGPENHVFSFRNINFTKEIARLGHKNDSKSKGF